jgi:hypothetical protein
MTNVLSVLHQRRGILVPLNHDALRLILVEVDVVLQRAGVHGPRDIHGLRGQPLEFLKLALMELDPADTEKFTHERITDDPYASLNAGSVAGFERSVAFALTNTALTTAPAATMIAPTAKALVKP